MKGTLADWILRAGLAFAFLYPPLNAWGDPNAWIGYFPGFLQDMAPADVLLHVFGVVEIILAAWVLSGWKIFIPCVLMAVMLVAIVAFNMPEFQVLFRDLSIAALAVVLALIHKPIKQI